MLRSLKSLGDHQLAAKDGPIGTVADFLIDDERWTVRYLVAGTGSFFLERQVLISPIFFGDPDGAHDRFRVGLTRQQIKDSPGIDLHQPVSRQHERDYYSYYGYPTYWGYGGLWGNGAYPASIEPSLVGHAWDENQAPQQGDQHLRSVSALHGYHLQGKDGVLGHVEDFFIDEQSWEVRYLAVDTSNWWLGEHVLVSPRWVSRVSWEEKKIHLALTREQIRESPVWNRSDTISREYEARLFDHYELPNYWEEPESSAAEKKADSRVAPMVLG